MNDSTTASMGLDGLMEHLEKALDNFNNLPTRQHRKAVLIKIGNICDYLKEVKGQIDSQDNLAAEQLMDRAVDRVR